MKNEILQAHQARMFGNINRGTSTFMFQLESFYVKIKYKKYQEDIKIIKLQKYSYLDPCLEEIRVELIDQ